LTAKESAETSGWLAFGSKRQPNKTTDKLIDCYDKLSSKDQKDKYEQ